MTVSFMLATMSKGLLALRTGIALLPVVFVARPATAEMSAFAAAPRG